MTVLLAQAPGQPDSSFGTIEDDGQANHHHPPPVPEPATYGLWLLTLCLFLLLCHRLHQKRHLS